MYGVRIEKALSQYHNTPGWENSPMGKLAKETGDPDGSGRNAKVWLEEIQGKNLEAAWAYKVVDAYWGDEDSQMTTFVCYDAGGKPIMDASFGVTYESVPNRIVTGGFAFKPAADNRYYVPIAGFPTHNDGGYAVCVLDDEFPSESLHFGFGLEGDPLKQGRHKTLTIRFRLMSLGTNYPND